MFYDNNSKGNNRQYDLLKPYIDSGFVIYHDWRGEDTWQQQKAYQKAYYMYRDNYDWMGFFDVDEFVELVQHKNIEDFLNSNDDFNKYKIIHLSWLNYGDCGELKYTNIPVQERFKYPSKLSNSMVYNKSISNYKENEFVKSFIKTDFTKLKWFEKKIGGIISKSSVHAIYDYREKFAINPSGEVVPNVPRHFSDYNVAFLKHYRTKTIEEYLYKFKRGDVIFEKTKTLSNSFKELLLNRFFKTNEKTEEKLKKVRETFPDIFLYEEWENIIEQGCNIKTSNIDYIFPYVDGTKEKWQKEYEKHCGVMNNTSSANGDIRYNPYSDLLKYKILLLEKNMPWLRNIFMIVSDETQVPEWIHETKVKIIYHREFIPEEFLPTFSSLTIEMFLGNISDLSEEFIYGNDDYYILKPLSPYNFFYNNKLVNDIQPYRISSMSSENTIICGEVYKRSIELVTGIKCVDERIYWFRHCDKPFLKSTFKKILEENKNILYNSITKQRNVKNYSMMQMATFYDLNKTIPNVPSNKAFFYKNEGENDESILFHINRKTYDLISLDFVTAPTEEFIEDIHNVFQDNLK